MLCDGVADDGEAGDVILVVFDAFCDDGDIVLNGGLSAGDSGDIGFIACELGGGGGAGDFDEPGLGHISGEPVAALGEGLWFAVDFRDFAPITASEQVMVDVHEDFAADSERESGEHIQCIDDASVGTVFDGYDPEVDVSAIHFLEDGGDGADGDEVRGFTEAGDCSLVGEAERGAEVGDADLFDALPAGAEKGAEDGAEFGGREGSLVDAVDGIPDLLLVEVAEGDARGRVCPFHFFEVERDAAIEELHELFIDACEFDFRRDGWGVGGRRRGCWGSGGGPWARGRWRGGGWFFGNDFGFGRCFGCRGGWPSSCGRRGGFPGDFFYRCLCGDFFRHRPAQSSLVAAERSERSGEYGGGAAEWPPGNPPGEQTGSVVGHASRAKLIGKHCKIERNAGLTGNAVEFL